jgi:hypothetical protein
VLGVMLIDMYAECQNKPIILSAVMSVVMLNVIMLNVVTPEAKPYPSDLTVPRYVGNLLSLLINIRLGPHHICQY